MQFLTPVILKKICPSLSDQRSQALADLFYKVLTPFGMYTVDILQEFLPQVAHESGEFRIKSESMNYRPERMMEIWPSRFPTLTIAQRFAGNPRALANYVYGKRMGNIKPDDGYNFIGGGFIQITGREEFTAYALAAGIKSSNSLMDDAEYAAYLCRTDDYYALHSACWEFAIEKKLLPLCRVNDFTTKNSFKTITQKINGGLIGYGDRLAYYTTTLKYLKAA